MKRRARCALGTLAALLAGALPVSAAEVDAFATPERWARRWAEGSLETGSDRGRVFLRCETQGDGALALVANRQPFDPPLDFTGRFPKVWIRVADVSRLAGMEIRLSSDDLAGSWFAFRVPLFEDERFGPLQSGSWVPLTLGFGSAEVVGRPDRSAIDAVGWVVRDHGSAAEPRPVVADWGGFALVDEPARGVISLTFDDGYDEHFEVAARLMAERGLRGTAYVIPGAVGRSGHMSLEQLHALRERYGWDVAAHHATPFTEMTPAELRRALRGIQHFLRGHGFREGALHVAFPLGKHDVGTVLPEVRRHFQTARLASAGPETLPPADAHRLRVVNVVRTTRPQEIEAAALRAVRHREWLILMFHYLVEEPRLDTEYAIEDFRRVVELLGRAGVPVRTLAEVWSETATDRPARHR
jgi:peptidoglycan/xylan/chitin deacetylase (PgdA/CDA1 family)